MGLALRDDPGQVWRVGFKPNPWAWSDWKYATDDGRFNGRWDDIRGQFRTVYDGQTLYACLIDVLAKYCLDSVLANALGNIVIDSTDAAEYPPRPAATVSFDWLEPRCASSGELRGAFCDVSASTSIAALWAEFVQVALGAGAADFDAAALKDSGPRDLTRSVASWLYAQTSPVVDGVEFGSRHGDDLRLWAIFERPSTESDTSPLIASPRLHQLTPETPELVEAFNTLGLSWST
ncbi:RES domain-containing protein [Herbiconiux sp. VKM Ac-2851]|uniref:RES domain-containing protein n=1 Tax=Herbiconiux sp. VKM Ac-2851 TaxID=2739025 RepID=UPI00156474A7|nr:RES domain-containing protein [Herbiconiux sp. VKM Ac-2851]NQX34728.1 RES domain-containing protein [Herbiconiux sp. VKM Ac-2851]